MDASLFLFLQLFDRKDDISGTEEQLTQGLWVCWFSQVRETDERRTKSHRGSGLYYEARLLAYHGRLTCTTKGG